MINSYLKNTLQYDAALCIGCAVCVEVCPHGVFTMNERLAVLANQAACMECGACQVNCPTVAIRVESGVGCAAAMIQSALSGKKEVSCECG
jgi:NAD-dependent dihydropyrimidine dehydrogenase PreA subunit